MILGNMWTEVPLDHVLRHQVSILFSIFLYSYIEEKDS